VVAEPVVSEPAPDPVPVASAPRQSPEDLEAVAALLAEVERFGTRGAPREWCMARLQQTTDIEACEVTAIGDGRAVVITMTLLCEDEHCEFQNWIINGRAAPIMFDDVVGTLPVLLPGGMGLLLGRAELTGPNEYTASLKRVSLHPGGGSIEAACAAPAISPSEKWIVCRDVDGDVHRMPIGGGPLTPVFDTRHSPHRDPHIGVALQPVEFIAPDRIRITTQEEVEETPWVE
jgi:hypothetical protein